MRDSPPKTKKKSRRLCTALRLLSPPYGLIVLPCCCCLCSSSSCRRSCGQSYNNFCHSLSRHCRAYLVSPPLPHFPLLPPSGFWLFSVFFFFGSVSVIATRMHFNSIEYLFGPLFCFFLSLSLPLSFFGGNFRKASKSFNFIL